MGSWKNLFGADEEAKQGRVTDERMSAEERKALRRRLDMLQYQVETMKRDFTTDDRPDTKTA